MLVRNFVPLTAGLSSWNEYVNMWIWCDMGDAHDFLRFLPKKVIYIITKNRNAYFHGRPPYSIFDPVTGR